MKQTASAIWHGNFKRGSRDLSTDRRVLQEMRYRFSTRFEGAKGTNPEELIAAAHSGFFTMPLSATLGSAGFTPKRLATSGAGSLELVAGNWSITSIHLENEAWIPGISAEKFEQIAADAKANCPVSRLLRADISLHAKLQNSEP